MSFDSRIGWFVVGSIVGFFLGYIVRSLREIKTEVHEVKLKQEERDSGFARNDWMTNVALLIVVCFTAYAAVMSQLSSNRSNDTSNSLKDSQSQLKDVTAQLKESQKQLQRVTSCTQTFLFESLSALNARTDNTRQQNAANADLQKSQLKFLQLFAKRPPVTQAERDAAFSQYVQDLSKFVQTSGVTNANVANNPFPTTKEYADCLRGS